MNQLSNIGRDGNNDTATLVFNKKQKTKQELGNEFQETFP
jgi:hypothetical protein